MKKLLFFFAVIFCFQTSEASHVGGGEFWYEHDTLNTYNVHFRMYRSCLGINAPDTITAYYNSASLSVPNTDFKMHITDTTLINTCVTNTCSNPTSSMPGFEALDYTATVNLPGTAADWYFYIVINARTITQNISTGSLFLDATLDNLNTPFNSSPIPYTPVDLIYLFNNQATVNLPAVDIDGDSLDFQFANPLTGNFQGTSSPLMFQSGYSVSNPFSSSPAPILNPLNGNLTLNPAIAGANTFAVLIDEYRNGIKIGSTRRDYIFAFSSNSTNSLPTLSGINNTTSFVTSVDVCPNSSLTFSINSSDVDVNDSSFIEEIYIPSGSSFITNVAQNQIGTFTWTPSLSDVQSQPYIISFKVSDNNCAQQSFAYQVFVNNCNPDSVWAGDANADYTCDNYDVLNIGIANGSTGAVRPFATTTWQAEWCPNWANSFVNNINYKHADCNGDGVVNNLDMAAIAANYGLVHQKNSQIGQYKTLGLPDLYCDVSAVQANKGSTVSIPVMLGNIGSTFDNFYGIAATVELLNAQTSAPISVSKNVSWIGNASNSFAFDHSLAPNKTAFTFVRNDQQNLMAQQGQIGEISFPIDVSSVTGSKVIVQFSDVKIIKNSGEEITDYNVLSDTLEILAPNSLNNYNNAIEVKVFPNPNKGSLILSIDVDRTATYSFSLYDAVGRKIRNNSIEMTLDQGHHDININMADKAAGQYFLELKTDGTKKVLPVQKW